MYILDPLVVTSDIPQLIYQYEFIRVMTNKLSPTNTSNHILDRSDSSFLALVFAYSETSVAFDL